MTLPFFDNERYMDALPIDAAHITALGTIRAAADVLELVLQASAKILCVFQPVVLHPQPKRSNTLRSRQTLIGRLDDSLDALLCKCVVAQVQLLDTVAPIENPVKLARALVADLVAK